MNDIPMFLAVWAGLVFSLILCRLAEGWVATKLGDPTPRESGMMTLSPIPHVDAFSTFILPAISFFSAGMLFGGTRPMPVNMMNFRNPLRGMMLVALADPLCHAALAVAFTLLVNFVPSLHDWNPQFAANYFTFLQHEILANLFIAMISLLPIPPQSGSRIVAAFLPPRLAYYAYAPQYQLVGSFIVLGLIMFSPLRNVILFPLVFTFKFLLQHLVFVGG